MTTSLTPIASPLDELLSGFFVRPMSLEQPWGGRPTGFRMDVYETENAYRVVADLPGVRKEDINISITGADVSVAAEVKREHTVGNGSGNGNGKAERQLVQERFAGKYSRVFSLGHEIDESKAQAKYENGVLELTLPKSASSLPKRITIQ
jgi:HSP20 family protein